MAENQAPMAIVGTLSTTDPDAGDIHTYSLVAGAGSTDNGSFTIVGASLNTTAAFDYETKSSYSIRVRTTDSTTRFFEKAFTVTVTNVNEAPADISLSSSSVAENQVSGTTVGTLSTAPPDTGDTHTYTLVAGTGSTDNASFTISGASVNTNAAFNFEAKSSYSIRVRTTDGAMQTFEKVFTITVTNVNEAPTDIGLSPTSVAENQASGTTVGTLSTTDVDAGNTHTYTLVAGTGSTDNASFTIDGAGLKTNAIFNFEAKSSYSIRVRTTDGGALTFEEAFTISVTNVNEAPVNTVPGAQTVNEDTDLTFASGGGNALSVADVDAGGGSIQTTVSALNGTITPASGSGATITGSGTASAQITGTLTQVNAALNGLKYRGTSNWNSSRGTATLTIVSNDQGNSGSGGVQSDTDTVGITVSAVNDAPTAAAKSFTVQANMKITGLSGLLTSATDPDTGDGGYTASFTVNDVLVDTCAASSTISNVSAAAGTFDFDPQPGFSGTCTLRYRVNDSGNPGPAGTSAYASISLTVNGPVIWFVNAAAPAGGNGRLSSPFNLLSAADAVDAANHGIFLYSGSYATGITLNSGEKVLGQATTGTTFDTFFGITPPTGTTARPALATGTVTVQGTVTLASTTTLRGLALSTGASAGLVGAGGLTGIDVAQVSVATTTGTAVNLNNAAGTYSFSSITTNGAANGILLDTLGTSSFTASGGSIVNASTRGVDINGGTGNFSYSGSISTSGTGRSVEVTGHTGGTLAFSGAVSDTGSGISLSSNTGATITFSGGVTASTGTNAAFTATGGGTVNVTGSSNTLATTTATALNVANTTIGASGLTFRSIASNGAVNGIVLNNTGNTAGLTVTGNSGAATGGTIQSSTGAGISLTSTRSPSFSWMVVQNGADDGIRGSGVVNFTLANSTISTNGDAVNESGVDFVGGLTGTASISSSTVTGSAENHVIVTNASGSLNFTVTGSTFTNASATVGNDGIHLDANDSAAITASITGSTFDNNRGDHFQFSTNASSTGTSSVTFSSNTLTGDRGAPFGNDLGAGITISTAGSSDTAFTVANNNIQGAVFPTIGIDIATASTAAASLVGTVNANTIGNALVAASGGAQSSSIAVVGQGAGTVTAAVTNNTIRQNDGFAAIDILSRDGSPTINATVTGNSVANPSASGGNGFLLRNGATSGPPADGGFTCAVITGNSFAGSAVLGLDDVRLRQRFNTTVRLPGYGGAAGDTAAVVAYVQGNNPGAETASATVDFPTTGGGFVGGAACPTP